MLQWFCKRWQSHSGEMKSIAEKFRKLQDKKNDTQEEDGPQAVQGRKADHLSRFDYLEDS